MESKDGKDTKNTAWELKLQKGKFTGKQTGAVHQKILDLHMKVVGNWVLHPVALSRMV